MHKPLLLLLAVTLSATGNAQPADAPQIEITNGTLRAKIYLPDPVKGYYRGTRFDWSGVIGRLEYKSHNYYGPWFTKTDPTIRDFIYDGPDIIAGPCSAVTGPVDEFVSNHQALGYEDAKAGGTFIKIGIGALRKPDEQKYSNYRLYDIVDPGHWAVHTKASSVEFVQQLTDPSSGYGYVYTKTIHLVSNKPEMVIEHTLKNTGKRAIETSVYNHNFLVLDNQPIGPDFSITLPFSIKSEKPPNEHLAAIRGNQIVYLAQLQDRDTVAAPLKGFGTTANDYAVTIENKKVGAGMKIVGDRPLSSEYLWSIRSVLAVEPYVDIAVQPGKEFKWKYSYSYYLLDSAGDAKSK
jgi:hypothetical protein